MAGTKFTEYRKGNTFLVVAEEGEDLFFWQYQEGARKRQPFASGYADAAIMADMVARFAGKEV